MFHTSIVWKKSLAVHTDDGLIIINPYADHQQTNDLFQSEKILGVICTPTCQNISFWQDYAKKEKFAVHVLSEKNTSITIADIVFHYIMREQSSFLTFDYDKKSILYDDHIVSLNWIEKTTYDTVFFDVANKHEISVQLAELLSPRVGVAMNVNQEEGIQFCRELMMNQICVPKYLMPGQHVIHT